jgi:shikimate 5-dehydrogenase
MLPYELTAADRPTFYFVGVTTGKSSIMQVFPRWAEHLGLGDCPIKGIDCRWHDDPAVYRHVVKFIKNDPKSLGGLVTTHKMDLLAACRDLFDELDPYADVLGEISCISKRQGKLKDPITSGLSLEAFLPPGHWERTDGEVCLLGAGGSSLAMTMYFMQICPVVDRPKCIRVTNRSAGRLDHMKQVHAKINPGIEVSYHCCPDATDNDAVVNRLPAGSLVVNATGLGKDAPGSPLTDVVRFPMSGWAWDFNYRGDLIFLTQARAQRIARRLNIEDGWIYFLHGWTRVIADVFEKEIPTQGHRFLELSKLAAASR